MDSLIVSSKVYCGITVSWDHGRMLRSFFSFYSVMCCGGGLEPIPGSVGDAFDKWKLAARSLLQHIIRLRKELATTPDEATTRARTGQHIQCLLLLEYYVFVLPRPKKVNAVLVFADHSLCALQSLFCASVSLLKECAGCQGKHLPL